MPEVRIKPTWQVRAVGREGFEFGLDIVTPISWTLVRSKHCGNALYALTLPEPANEAYGKWLKENRGKTIIASVQELRQTVSRLRAA